MSESINDSWNRIAAWIDGRVPDLKTGFAAGANQEQLDSAASAMNAQLPSDFRELYMILDGVTEGGLFPSHDEWDEMAYGLMSLEQVVADWQMLAELVESGDFEDCTPSSETGVQNDWWNLNWIPFADNGGGDYFCLDLAPTEQGEYGQVITHSHETGEHKILANSLAEYLQGLADRLDANEFEYDEDYGIRPIETS